MTTSPCNDDRPRCAVWALQAAIDDVPTSRLSAATKQALKDAVAKRRNGSRDA